MPPGREILASLLDTREDGRLKMYVMHRALALRHSSRTLFASGSYVPLAIRGASAASIFAFARVHGDEAVVCCVPRLVTHLPGDPAEAPLGSARWQDTAIVLPPDFPSVCLTNALTGERLSPADHDGRLNASDVFAHAPVALLTAASALPGGRPAPPAG
jgi:(1->4)-alpha-D-glucan 1-alpha-D-glucosylmutase